VSRIGKYSITDIAGGGAHGIVFNAIDTELDRPVAIKSLQPSTNNSRELFAREAKSLAKLSHPNIVTIYDLIEHEGEFLLVMQHINGENLSDYLKNGLLSLDVSLNIMVQITDALVTAHRAGITHGDIKPENIMIDKDAVPYLVDFGLARFWSSDDVLATRFSSKAGPASSLDGTLPYMAPEKIMGRVSDHRSDIFSLGAVFYEMLAGRRAFAGDNHGAVLNGILNTYPPAIGTIRPEMPLWLSNLINGMLEKEPESRIETMEKIQIALIAQKQHARPNRLKVKREGPDTKARSLRRLVAFTKLTVSLAAFSLLSWVGALALGYEVRPISMRMAKGIELIGHFDKNDAVNESKTIFSGILSANPEHAGAEAGMALALIREYTSKEADPATLRRATIFAKSALESDPQLALANIAAAWAAEFNGDFSRAGTLYDRANLLDPDNALIFEGRARLFKKRNDLPSAIKLLQAAIKAHPKQRIYYDAYGEILAIQGDFLGAERLFRQGLTVEPDNLQGYANLAQSLHMQGKTKDAIRTVQDGLRIGENTSLYNNLGTYLFFQGQYEKAVEAFERTLGLEGDAHDYLAWANLADAQRYVPSMSAKAKDSYRRAIQLIKKDLDKSPRDEGLNSRLALYAAKSGDFQTARAALLIATVKATKDPRTYYRGMVTQHILGNRQSAMAYLRRALESGYPLSEVENDPDLAKLRQDAAYQLIISKWEDVK
jgi:eukaryotic-like serine/threonine-protein kinase